MIVLQYNVVLGSESAVQGAGSLVFFILILCILQMKAIPLCFDGLMWPCCDPVVATFPRAIYHIQENCCDFSSWRRRIRRRGFRRGSPRLHLPTVYFLHVSWVSCLSERLTVTCHRGFLAQRPVSVSQRRKRPVRHGSEGQGVQPAPDHPWAEAVWGGAARQWIVTPQCKKSPVFVKGCNRFRGPYDGI